MTEAKPSDITEAQRSRLIERGFVPYTGTFKSGWEPGRYFEWPHAVTVIAVLAFILGLVWIIWRA